MRRFLRVVLRAIFNSYRDSCQHLLAAAVYSCGCLAFASLPDSLLALRRRLFFLSFLLQRDLYPRFCASVQRIQVFCDLFKGMALKKKNNNNMKV